ncbi:AzlC family ABC transporter permease [Corynebacterium sp. 335C]
MNATEIRRGIADTWAVGLGLVPLGLAFGLLVAQSGFAWWWAPVFSVIVYAGSMEFLAVGLVLAHTGLIGSAVTAFLVNFRHIFYGLTFPRDAVASRVGCAYSTYALTDESWAIVSAVQARGVRPSGPRTLTVQILCQLLWVVPGILGALLGTAIPDDVRGVDFALTALFAVLAVDAFRSHRDWSLPITALACAGVGWWLSPEHMLVIGLPIYVATLVARTWSPALDRALTWTGARR